MSSQKISITTLTAKYPIYIGALKTISHLDKVLIVSNPKVAGLYLDSIISKIKAPEIFVSIVPDGESYKNWQSIEQILETAFIHQLNRKSLMIGLGGGVISDMVGFASGIYQRGIDFIAIPTTLLAQVDASVGGKTGVNNKFGKNLVGVFHQPKAVYINLDFLKTLPEREFKAGVAEIIKMAVCFDGEFFDWLTKNDLKNFKNLQKAISKSIEIKAKIVSSDEKEQGIRAGLNYGHTFGHIIENQTNYKKFLHGEAVAIGMQMANDLALRLKLINQQECQEINNLLKRYGLDLRYHIEDIEEFYERFFLDKKSHSKKIKFILPKGIGNLVIIDNVSKGEILKTLKAWSKN